MSKLDLSTGLEGIVNRLAHDEWLRIAARPTAPCKTYGALADLISEQWVARFDIAAARADAEAAD